MSQHRHLSRRAFLGSAAITAVGLPVLFGKWQPTFAAALGDSFVPPESPRRRLNFDLDWKFVREDVPGAETLAFDDSKWITISTPHTFNDVDSFRTIISHGGGDRGTYKGLSWYRKHFKLPANLSGRKVFLEFEGMRQAGDIYLNGRQIGLYENGVTPYGIDISGAVNLGAHENVLAVKVDNRTNYAERGTGTTFEWNANDFNPDYGGINRHVSLHVTGKIYQTLPLYCGLNCSGVYVHAANFNISKKTADVTVESEVCNESGERATVVLSAIIVDPTGGSARGSRAMRWTWWTARKPSSRATELKEAALLEHRRPVSLQRPYHADGGREGGGRRQDRHRIPQDGVQGRGGSGRSLHQR